jgi:hypothetical protein
MIIEVCEQNLRLYIFYKFLTLFNKFATPQKNDPGPPMLNNMMKFDIELSLTDGCEFRK